MCKSNAKIIGEELEQLGHIITKKWWDHREVPTYLTDDHSNDAELVRQAWEDYNGVVAADAFVLLNWEKSEGKAVETGFALMEADRRDEGYDLHLVGGKSNLFHYIGNWVPHVDEEALLEYFKR